ncbi:hypothetical protein [Singulisphaera sp. PoT]|uniref:hypothetical protein n=1 Tax=Singulisphaera sp. PoT TaxID=3411797 RepID=UPI003BF538FE
MVETTSEPQRIAVLRIFERLNDPRLTAAELKKKLGIGTKKGTDPAEANQTLASLIEQGFLAISGGAQDAPHPRPNAAYRLTREGIAHLRPARPDFSDELLQAQEAFILLQVFRAKEQKLTRSDLNGKLKSRAAVGQLEFDVKAAPETIDYHLAELVDKQCLTVLKRGVSISFELNPEKGAAALASSKQHEAVSFTLTGETLNALLTTARQSKVLHVAAVSAESGELPTVDMDNLETPPKTLSPLEISKFLDQLRTGKYAGKDLIPIHELRQLVGSNLGEALATHAVFDRIVKEMRSDGQLEVIAISDNRDATQEQLDDSIPGMNETLFYIVVG